jgi:MFS family permease
MTLSLPEPQEDPSPLRSPAFLLVCAITFLTFLAAFQLFPTVPLRMLELGARREQTGYFMTVFTAGSALGALFTGPLGDRVGQRRMMIVAAIGFAVCLGLYGFIHLRWWLFPVLALPHGIVWSGLLTTTMPILGEVLPETHRASGIALYGLTSPAGAGLGPMIGLAFFRHFGFPSMAIVLAGIFLLISLLALSLPKDRAQRGIHPPFHLPSGVMLAPCALLFTMALAYGSLGTFTPQELLKLGQGKPWIFLTCMAAGMVSLRIIISRVGLGPEPMRWMKPALWISFAGLACLALAPGAALRHAGAAYLYGVGYSSLYTIVNLYVFEQVDPSKRGSAFGSMLFAFDSGIGLGAFMVGQIIGRTESTWGATAFRLGWSATALAAFVSVILGYRLVKEAARRKRQAE